MLLGVGLLALTGCGENSSSAGTSIESESSISVSDSISPVEKTIDEMITVISGLADKKIDTSNAYKISGTVMNVVDSEYGNFDLYNDDFSKYLTVWGSTTTASALSLEGSTATWTNPKDFVYGTTIHEGDKVTMTVLAEKYGTTNEVMGVIDASSISLSTTRKNFTASINNPTNGTATLSKTSGIYIGEELMVTTAPAEGYIVGSVKVNDKAVTGSDNSYKFTAKNTNSVEVAFIENNTVGTVNYNVKANATSFSNQSTSYLVSTGTIDGVSIECTKASYNAPTGTSLTGAWASDPDKEVIIAANASTEYVTVTATSAISAAKFNLRSWTTKAQKITFDVESSADGTTWTSTGTSFTSSAISTGADFTVASGDTAFSSTKVRLSYTTAETSNETCALLSIDLTY